MSESNLQANDSLWGRRTAPAFGQGVTSWNGQTGAVVGTLASIYGFGLGDVPALDNFFPMPEGHWNFPGEFLTTPAKVYGIGYIDQTAVVGNANPWNYVRLNGESGGAFNLLRTFNAYGLNDPAWNGSPNSLASSPVWQVDLVSFGNAALSDPTRTFDVTLGTRYYQYGSIGYTFPNAPGNSLGETHTIQLFDLEAGGLRIATSTNGSGQTINFPQTQQHGITPAFTASALFDQADQAGDGTGFFVSYGQAVDFTRQRVRGGFTSTTLADAGDPAGDSWVSSIWAYETGQGAMNEVFRCYADVGGALEVGGLEWPIIPVAGFPVSHTGAARIIFDQTSGKFLASVNGAAYVNLSAVS